MDYGKKTKQQLSSERQGTAVHREEYNKEFRDHGFDSKLSFGKKKNVAGVLTS